MKTKRKKKTKTKRKKEEGRRKKKTKTKRKKEEGRRKKKEERRKKREERRGQKKNKKSKTREKYMQINADMSYPEKHWSKTGDFKTCLRQSMWTDWPSNSQGQWTLWLLQFTVTKTINKLHAWNEPWMVNIDRDRQMHLPVTAAATCWRTVEGAHIYKQAGLELGAG